MAATAWTRLRFKGCLWVFVTDALHARKQQVLQQDQAHRSFERRARHALIEIVTAIMEKKFPHHLQSCLVHHHGALLTKNVRSA